MGFSSKGGVPLLLRFRSSTALIVTTAAFAIFTDVFLYAVIVPVFPFALETRIGIPQEDVQYWVSIGLAVFGAALFVSSPIWGYLADRIQNRRVPMLLGLVLLTGATLFLCLARSIALLLIGRALQGLCAALTWTVGLALVIDSVDKSGTGAATGWIGTALSLATLLGPLLGGVVYGRGGYYSVFAMCFGLLAVDILLRIIIIEKKEAQRWSAEEHVAPTLSPQTGDQNIQPAPTKAIHSPIKTLWTLLRKPRLLSALWGTLVYALVTTGFDSVLPLFVSSTFGWDSIGAGLIFLPIVIPAFLGPIVGMVGDRYGPKWLATFGFTFSLPFLVCLRFVEKDSSEHKAMLCGLLFGIGTALACVVGPLMAEITWAIEDGTDSQEAAGVVPYAQAYGLYNVAFSCGTLVGPVMAGMIREHAGWSTVSWSMAITMAFTAITQLLWTGGQSLRLARPSK